MENTPEALRRWVEDLPGRAADHLHRTGRPRVTLSYAQSLDGSLTARRGEPLALSGPESMRLTHRLRAAHAAILVGIGTLLADDPQLSVRRVEGRSPQPVVLDSRLRFPPAARLLQRRDRQPWAACTPQAPPDRRAALESAGARVLVLPADPQGGVDLPALLDCLGELGVSGLMVEGGARVIGAFLSAGLVDAALVTIAPLWVGGLNAVERPLGGAAGEFPRLEAGGSARLGEDVVVWGRVRRNHGAIGDHKEEKQERWGEDIER